jgi:hypothetical protein
MGLLKLLLYVISSGFAAWIIVNLPGASLAYFRTILAKNNSFMHASLGHLGAIGTG